MLTRTRTTTLLLCVWSLFQGCRTPEPGRPPTSKAAGLGQGHPLNGRIWSVSSRAFISQPQLIARLVQRRLVLLGEKHDNRRHHLLQARILEGLTRAGRRPTVIWEMITSAEEAALERFLARRARDARALGPAVRWSERGWPDWASYQPIAEVALEAGLPMLAGGVGREVLMRAFHGAHGHDVRAASRPVRPRLPPAARAALARSVRASHCGHASARMVKMMIRAQEHRDSFMARQLLAASSRGEGAGGVLIAGNEHVRRDRGAPFFLRALGGDPAPSVAVVGLLEVQRGEEDPAGYARPDPGQRPPFDYLWFTARVDNEDPCEKFKQQLQRMQRMRKGGPHD